jgi:hypothetical protein
MTYPAFFIFLLNFLRGKSDAISHLADVDKVTGHDDGHFYSRHFCHHSHLGTFLRPYLTLLARDRRLMAHLSVPYCDEIISSGRCLLFDIYLIDFRNLLMLF